MESVKVDPIEIVDALNSKSIELLNEKSEEVALINDNPDEVVKFCYLKLFTSCFSF